MTTSSSSGEAKVVYVRKEHAKAVKNYLKEVDLLDDRFRMLKAAAGSGISIVDELTKDFIVIPVHDNFDENKLRICEESDQQNDLGIGSILGGGLFIVTLVLGTLH